MADWMSAFLERFNADFLVCRCDHFSLKHDLDTGECFGVDLDDHSIRCECRQLDVVDDPDE